jgi:hypothetical protein
MIIASGWPELQPRPTRLEKLHSHLTLRIVPKLLSKLSMNPFGSVTRDPEFGYAKCLWRLRTAAAACYGAAAVAALLVLVAMRKAVIA